jgi:hypothetical protein
MGKYTVITGQNLYDVALDIYGSIEGITDLLICNPQLSMAARLRSGDVLDYSDDYLIDAETVAYLHREGITPAGGERHVYFKETALARRAEFCLPAAAVSASLSLAGSGTIEIDWGDNSALQAVMLTDRPSALVHPFDNVISGRRTVRLYGDFALQAADLTGLAPDTIRLFSPLYIEELTFRNCHAPLEFLPLMEGLYALDLRGAKVADLRPLLECRSLMRLDMTDMDVPRQALNGWLIALVEEHYGRRACEVLLPERPSGEYREPVRDGDLNYVLTCGMEAVWLLTHEEAWNEGGPWRFFVDGVLYEYEPVAPLPEPEPEPDPDPTPPWHSGGMDN